MGLAYLLVLVGLLALAAAAEVEKTISIFAWPISAPASQPLATISYTYPSLNATVKTYNTALSLPDSADPVRIGFFRSSSKDEWSGIATSARNLAADREKKLRLWVDGEGAVFHVGFTSEPVQVVPVEKGRKTQQQEKSERQDTLLVEVVPQRAAPQPQLNKPIVLNAEGKVDGKEPEKSLLQR